MKSKPLAASLFFILMIFGAGSVFAKVEYFTKEKATRPEVTCMTCHDAVPKKDEKAKHLNETGTKYQKDKKLPSK